MPGRLPNHGFREGSGAVFQVRAGFQRGSGRVPGQVPGHCFRNRRLESFGASSGQGSKEVTANLDQGAARASSGQGSNPVRR